MAADLVSRRAALKFAGLITLAAHSWNCFPARAMSTPAQGYGMDPDLLKRILTWPRTLTSTQLAALARLGDIILPAEAPHPSAGAVGVHVFLDEWVSAPYPQMAADRVIILNGLTALNDAMHAELGILFTAANPSQQAVMFERFCSTEETARFSRRLIELVCAGYYTTREGHAAIGYVGNVALTSFPGPPREVVRGLEEVLRELPPTPMRG
jgi:hypothetical protein